ncbi:hypothetical protein B0H11DRAFT_2259903 [Mycena galericulata]|nr:hypothetical protein B0H11DRAFT_2259903 [Mycena galericulata]
MSTTAGSLQKTHMTAAEMIPDDLNPLHDRRYWCLPPVCDRPSEAGNTGRFPVYLVGQGRIVGIWHNWTAVESMVTGFPGGSQRGHQSQEGCVREWQVHCALGVHPHPADPVCSPEGRESLREATPIPAGKGGLGVGRSVEAGLQAALQKHCMPDLSGYTQSPSSTSTASSSGKSKSTSSWKRVPHSARYYAIWSGGAVFTERALAKEAFREAENRGGQAQVLSTHDFEEARAYSEGVYWISD